jgi:hemerythrin superfamily protein
LSQQGRNARTEEPTRPEEFTDAIALLKADHRKVEDLFGKFCKATAKERKWKLAQEICQELKIHTAIEEEIFYPAVEGEIDDSLYHEAFVEHDGAKMLINDVLANGPEDPFFEAKVTVLCEEISHHVKEEERPKEGFFAQAREAGADMVELRDLLMARKQELMGKAENGGLPPAQLATMHLQAA